MTARLIATRRTRTFGQALIFTGWMVLGTAAGALAWNAMPILEFVSELVAPPPKEGAPRSVPVAYAPRKIAPPNLQRPVVAGYSAAAIQQAASCTTATKPSDGDAPLSSCPVGGFAALARGNGRKTDRLIVAPAQWSTTVVEQAAR